MTSLGAITNRLKRAEWLAHPDTQRLMALLGGREGRTRAVGGIVRDTLLDLPRAGSDIDLATELHPAEVAERAEAAGVAIYPTGIEHGTLTLRCGELVAEVTTLREDVATDGRHAVVRFGTDWVRDAQRRDFTMNALYAGIDGDLFDPLAGLGDCVARVVRFIGRPEQRIAEDRLRVFRFFRFSASHGNEHLDPEGYSACKAAANTLDRLAAERVGAEMRRMLALPRIGNTLIAMRRADVLALPEAALTLLHAYERRARRPDIVARLALVIAEFPAEQLQAMWRLPNDEIRDATVVLAVAQLLGEFRLNEAAYRHPAALADGIDVAAALFSWSEAGKAAIVEKLQRLNVPRFPIGGAELLKAGLKPGPALGATLDELEKAWIESDFTLDRDALLDRIRP